MLRFVTLSAAGIVAVAAAGCGGSGAPGNNLVVVSTRDGDYALYGMSADGSDQGRLTDETGESETPSGLFFQVEPAWAPDGGEIVFTSKRGGSLDLYVMDAAGEDTRRLTSTKEDESHPTWSPDGTRVAFARSDGNLYVMPSAGGAVRPLTSTLLPEYEPAWSPDGTSIAYTRRVPGTLIREVWVLDVASRKSRKVTSLNAQCFTPAWSPDGTMIAFSVNRGGGRYAIHTIGSDGTGLRRVTAPGGDDAIEPAWSPDGSLIAFSRGGSIVTIDDAGTETVLTDPENNDSSPAWNPKPGAEEES
jgi:Tol biopolymer transport system component